MPNEPQQTDRELRDAIITKAMAKVRDRKPEPQQKECAECGSLKGHRLSCVSGNEQARKAQGKLERNYAVRQLREIHECDKCDLCEDHHG